MEATEVDGVTKRTAEIEYDLQPLPKDLRGYDPTEGKLIYFQVYFLRFNVKTSLKNLKICSF